MADGQTLGDFYFDVIFKDSDKNAQMERELKERIDRISQQKLKIGIDTSGIDKQIDKIKQQFAGLGSALQASLSNVAATLNLGDLQKSLQGQTVWVLAKLYADADASLKELEQQFVGKGIRVDVYPNVDKFKFEAELTNIKNYISKLQQAIAQAANAAVSGGGSGSSAQQQAQVAADSYNGLKEALAKVVAEYKKLSEAERNGASGQTMLEHIRSLQAEIKGIDDLLKPVVKTYDALTAAQDKLSKLRSDSNTMAVIETNQDIAATERLIKLKHEQAQLADPTSSQAQLKAEQQAIRLAELQKKAQSMRDQQGDYFDLRQAQQALSYAQNLYDVREKIASLEKKRGDYYDLRQEQERLSLLERQFNVKQKLDSRGNLTDSEKEARNAERRLQIAERRYEIEQELARISNPIEYNKERRTATAEKEIELLRQKMNLEAEIAARQSMAQRNPNFHQDLADQQRSLELDKERVRLQAELNGMGTRAYREVTDLRTELALKKELERTERELAILKQREQEMNEQRNIDIQGTKTKINLTNELIRKQARLNWLQEQYRGKDARFQGMTNADAMRQINKELDDLEKNYAGARTQQTDLNKSLASGIPLLQSLKNLARNYIGVFGAWSALKSLMRIRAEFERQEVALRALMQSAAKATETMNRLQQMALQSPFSVADITSFAKQLSAFSIPNADLLDTTKRLADLSAGLGVDMSRLILAYGQVKAATVLRGQELRQFTEAGVPMVKELADHFTRLEGKLVTAADIFQRISKKQVAFEDVKKVLENMTNEGGRFYDHQAKMVETLYGKMERLGDAWKVMMNNLGKSSDGLLKAMIDAPTKLLLNWRSTVGFLVSAGLAKGVNSLFAWFGRVSTAAKDAGKSTKDFISGKIFTKANWYSLAIFGISELVSEIIRYNNAIKASAEAVREYGNSLSGDLDSFLLSRKEPMLNLIDAGATKLELKQVWEEIEEQVRNISGHEVKLGELLQIEDLGERSKQAIEYLENIKKAADALKGTDLEPNLSFSFLGMGTDGLDSAIDNLSASLKRLKDAPKEVQESFYAYLVGGKSGIGLPQVANQYKSFLEQIDELTGEMIAQINSAPIDPKNSEQLHSFVQGMINGIASEMPNMTRDMRALFEASIYQSLSKSLDKSKYAVEDFTVGSTVAVESFFSLVRKQALDAGIDIEQVLKDINSGNKNVSDEGKKVFEDMCKKALESAKTHAPQMYGVYYNMVQDLNKLTFTIQGRLNIDMPSDFQRWWDKENPDASQEERNKFAPKKGQDQISHGKEMHESRVQAEKELKQKKELKKRAKLQEEQIQLYEDIKRLEKDIAGYRAEEERYYVDEEKKTASTSKRTGRGTQKDVYLERIKHQFSVYKTMLQEIDRFSKLMSREDALKKVQGMDWEGVSKNTKYLVEGGLGALAKDLLPAMIEHAKKLGENARQGTDAFIKELNKAVADADYEKVKRLFDEMGERIKEEITLSVSRWNLFDKLFAQTGDKSFSALFAFGGENIYKNAEEQLRAIFERNSAKMSFNDAFGKSKSELTSAGVEEYFVTILDKVKELRKKKLEEITDVTAKALEEQMSVEERIKNTREKYLRYEQDYIDARRKIAEDNDEIISDNEIMNEPAFKALEAKMQEAIAALESEAFSLSEAWEKIFADMTYKTYGQVKEAINLSQQLIENAVAKTDKNGKVLYYKSWYKDSDGSIQRVKMMKREYEQVFKGVDKLFKAGENKNPFRSMGDTITNIIKTLKNGKKVAPEMWAQLASGASACSKIVGDLSEGLSSMFDAMGDEDSSSLFKGIADAFSGIDNIASGFANGGVMGGIVAGAQTAIGWLTKIFQSHDAALQKYIERSQLRVKEMENLYGRVEKLVERTLGGVYEARLDESMREQLERIAYGAMYKFGIAGGYEFSDGVRKGAEAALKSGTSYSAQLALYKAQLEELGNQRNAEMDKKKQDASAIEDYNKQIADMEDQIAHFAEDMAKAIYDIDVKSWAQQLTDSIVDAWASGENAANAYKDTVTDIMKGLTKNILAQKVVETAMQPVLDEVVRQMTATEGQLDEGTIKVLTDMLLERSEWTTNTLTSILDRLKSEGYDLSEAGKSNTIGQGIQSITEDTANLLGSYVNAIRADVSALRMIAEEERLSRSVIATAQAAQLQSIIDNTLRNAEAAERIESALSSVITFDSGGALIRV